MMPARLAHRTVASDARGSRSSKSLRLPARAGHPATPGVEHVAILPFDLLPGEAILWEGRPSTRALARRLLRVSWLGLYFAAAVAWGFYDDRSGGLSIAATLWRALPTVALGITTVAACHALAFGWARTTRYFVTTERCVLHIGLALTGTLSLPWRRVERIALAIADDGTGDIALAPVAPHRLRFTNLWPHARGVRIRKPEPMLRCIANAAEVGALMRDALTRASRRPE